MCGIAGIWDPRNRIDHVSLQAACLRMIAQLGHRGPDGSGTWSDEGQNLVLGHRRLSIIDLSETGAQPMRSGCGRFVTVFNGEIYNYRELRRRIEADFPDYAWRGSSDTEVLLAVVSAFGLERALEFIEGMFAFAIWDRERQEIALVRDRIGEKPLYYSSDNGILIFASEIKALRASALCSEALDREAANAFLRYGYIPSPLSIFTSVRKLEPGHLIVFGVSALMIGTSTPIPFWRPHVSMVPNETWESEDVICRTAHDLLFQAVKKELVADVPVGAFLSGGIDSSAVVCMMRKAGCEDLNTFSVGFDEDQFDESAYAAEVGEALGTKHHALRVTANDALKIIPELPQIYDEPFADSSQIPTILVSRFARSRVKVALSGDGGDEMFGGYNRYVIADSLWPKLQTMPGWLRACVIRGSRAASTPVIDRLFPRNLLPERLRFAALADKFAKLSGVVSASSGTRLYEALTSQWDDSSGVVNGHRFLPLHPALSRLGPAPNINGLAEWMMAADRLTYLPDDILVKVDRASMSTSLECRQPFLDRSLVEFASKLPIRFLIRQRRTKWLLRKILDRYLPGRMFARPKAGFGVPIASWLRGPLQEWAEDLLSAHSLEVSGLLCVATVRKAWAEHLAGTRNLQYQLWNILILQQWLRQRGPHAPHG